MYALNVPVSIPVRYFIITTYDTHVLLHSTGAEFAQLFTRNAHKIVKLNVWITFDPINGQISVLIQQQGFSQQIHLII